MYLKGSFCALTCLFCVTVYTCLHAATVTWDGGAVDTLWTSPENWSDNQLPAEGDDVIFDQTSTKDCTVPTYREVPVLNSMKIKPGYLGNIHFTPDPWGVVGSYIEVADAFEIAGGRLSGILTLEGAASVSQTGGELGGLNFSFHMNDLISLDITTGQNGLSLQEFRVQSHEPGTTLTITLNGDLFAQQVALGRSSSNQTIIMSDGSLTLTDGPRTDFNLSATQLQLHNGFHLDTSRVPADNYDSSGKIIFEDGSEHIHIADTLGLANRLNQNIQSISPGENWYIILEDVDETRNGTNALNVQVTVQSLVTSESEIVQPDFNLDPFSDDFDAFAGHVYAKLPTEAGEPVPGDGTFQLAVNDRIQLSYQDPNDPADQLTWIQGESKVVWVGGFDENRWNTPENWSNGRRPGRFDDVIFDGSTTLPCQLTIGAMLPLAEERPTRINHLTLEADYPGTVSLVNLSTFSFSSEELLIVYGDFTQHGGSISFKPENRSTAHPLVLFGSLNLSGGSNDIRTYYFEGIEDVSIYAPGHLFSAIWMHSDASRTITVNSSLGIYGYFAVFADRGYLSTLRLTTGTVSLTNPYPDAGLVVSDDSRMIIEDGVTLDVYHAGKYLNFGEIILNGSAQALRYAEIELLKTYGLPTQTATIPSPGDVFISVKDPDQSLLGNTQETLSATVRSPDSGDLEPLTLTETSGDGAVFSCLLQTALTGDGVTTGNSILEVNPGDTIYVEYTDPDDPQDVQVIEKVIDPRHVRIQEYMLGNEIFSSLSNPLDANGDGEVDIADIVTEIIRYHETLQTP